MIYGLARTALFALDPEISHDLTLALLARAPRLSTAAFAGRVADAPVELMGLRFRNPVGLAAGLDKNGDCIEAFDRLGFGFIEVGTVTPRPQPGNPRPRLFRLPGQRALINRLGFNNRGVDDLATRLRDARPRAVLGVNVGKNFDTPLERAADDYVACLQKVYAHADYVTVNISSPNTQNLRDLQDRTRLTALLRDVLQAREALAQRHGRRVPIVVKIAPDLEEPQLAEIADTARALGVDALIATNTTTQRPGLAGCAAAQQAGGLSGAPLKPLAEDVLQRLRKRLGRDFPLIGAGGILSGADARERRAAGADLVQVYTGFIYRGPALVAECARALLPGRAPLR